MEGAQDARAPSLRLARQCLVYSNGIHILRRGEGAFSGFGCLTRRVRRGFSCASDSTDLDGESGGLSGEIESKYFGPRAVQAA